MLDKFRAVTQTLSSELLASVRGAWEAYVRTKVCAGLAVSDSPAPGAEWDGWPALVQKFTDKAWKAEGLKRDEKFEMHFNAAVRRPVYPAGAATDPSPLSPRQKRTPQSRLAAAFSKRAKEVSMSHTSSSTKLPMFLLYGWTNR